MRIEDGIYGKRKSMLDFFKRIESEADFAVGIMLLCRTDEQIQEMLDYCLEQERQGTLDETEMIKKHWR